MKTFREFEKVFNSTNFSVVNPFLNQDGFGAIKNMAASAICNKTISSEYHFPGHWINYKSFKFNSFSSISDFKESQKTHPALVCLPPWLKDQDLSYWFRNEVEYIEKFAQYALENGIDLSYVPRSLALRFFFFTMSSVFNKFYFDSVKSNKIIIDESYDKILLPDGSSFSVKPLEYPLVLKNLNLSASDQQQYISSVPVDVPFSLLQLDLFKANSMGIQKDFIFKDSEVLYSLHNFYKEEKSKLLVEEFFKDSNIRSYHCGDLSKFSDGVYSDLIKHYATFKDNGSSISLTVQDIF